MLEEIINIFESNKDKRILVLGTTCTGKSYIIDHYGLGRDMDEEIFPKLTKEETDYVCSTPWTEEIGIKMTELVRERISPKAGEPLFGTVLMDCDLIIYLHISDELLYERTKLRDVDFMNAKNMQSEIEREIKDTNINCITIEVSEEKKNNEEFNFNKHRI